MPSPPHKTTNIAPCRMSIPALCLLATFTLPGCIPMILGAGAAGYYYGDWQASKESEQRYAPAPRRPVYPSAPPQGQAMGQPMGQGMGMQGMGMQGMGGQPMAGQPPYPPSAYGGGGFPSAAPYATMSAGQPAPYQMAAPPAAMGQPNGQAPQGYGLPDPSNPPPRPIASPTPEADSPAGQPTALSAPQTFRAAPSQSGIANAPAGMGAAPRPDTLGHKPFAMPPMMQQRPPQAMPPPSQPMQRQVRPPQPMPPMASPPMVTQQPAYGLQPNMPPPPVGVHSMQPQPPAGYAPGRPPQMVQPPAPPPQQQASPMSFLNDSYISNELRAQFWADPALQGSNISVTTEQGVAVLSGTVQSGVQLQRAETLARSTQGIQAVENRLRVVSP